MIAALAGVITLKLFLIQESENQTFQVFKIWKVFCLLRGQIKWNEEAGAPGSVFCQKRIFY